MIHFAAGILPVTWHGGTLLFLVGKDVRDNQSWSDFGGKAERMDRNDPILCGLREFNEETYGTVMSPKAVRARMHAGRSILLKSHTQNGYPYFCYLVEVNYTYHLRNAFHKVLGFLRSRNIHRLYVEKTDIQWVTWDMLQTMTKRQVFSKTIDCHKELLERISKSAPHEWTSLCAQNAAGFDSRPS